MLNFSLKQSTLKTSIWVDLTPFDHFLDDDRPHHFFFNHAFKMCSHCLQKVNILFLQFHSLIFFSLPIHFLVNFFSLKYFLRKEWGPDRQMCIFFLESRTEGNRDLAALISLFMSKIEVLLPFSNILPSHQEMLSFPSFLSHLFTLTLRENFIRKLVFDGWCGPKKWKDGWGCKQDLTSCHRVTPFLSDIRRYQEQERVEAGEGK